MSQMIEFYVKCSRNSEYLSNIVLCHKYVIFKDLNILGIRCDFHFNYKFAHQFFI